MTKRIRAIAAILAGIVAVVILSSSLYIAAEADHDCHGADCLICAHIVVCENTLRELACAVLVAVAATGLTYAFVDSVSYGKRSYTDNTLVSLKVKLSN